VKVCLLEDNREVRENTAWADRRHHTPAVCRTPRNLLRAQKQTFKVISVSAIQPILYNNLLLKRQLFTFVNNSGVL